MRPSNKQKMLEASIAIVEREGVTGLTYESVAEEMGMTKGGIMHHFPTREALVREIYEYMAKSWSDEMEALAGKPREEATELERLAAYVEGGASSVTRAQLLLLLEGVHNPDYIHPMSKVLQDWVPDLEGDELSLKQLKLLVAQLASDGLWLLEAWSPGNAPNTRIKQQVVAFLKSSLMESDE